MNIPVIKPEGRLRQLKLGQNTVTANPHLVFATTNDLYSLEYKAIKFPPGPSYRIFTAYRVMETVRTEGIYSPGMSCEVTAFRQARAAMKSDRQNPGEDLTVHFRRLMDTAQDLYTKVPDVPLTQESKTLPPGSLLLCRQNSNNEDTWYAVTPDQFEEENLQRALVCEQGVISAFSSMHYEIFQRDFLRGWPDENKAAHLGDIDAVMELEKPPVPKKPTGNSWFDNFIGIFKP